jgi:hypothetical protein
MDGEFAYIILVSKLPDAQFCNYTAQCKAVR